jgi:peptidoglycan/xylan/chitin deacetylase (PgdA/CDA1 family)
MAENRIPILMYHSISGRKETTHPYFQTCTSPAVFESHMRYLKENHYAVVSLEKAVEELSNGKTENRKAVVITFDDGYLDFYTHAAPILKKHGFPATVFLPAGFITDSGTRFNEIECLDWSQIRELMRAGFSFGSHTLSHPQLYDLKPDSIEYELTESKRRIEAQTGKEITLFSYPYAFPDHNAEFAGLIKRLLRTTGYKIGVTTRLGTCAKKDLPFLLKRIPVNGQDDLRFFGAKLEGGYDWLYPPQLAYKSLKSRIRQISSNEKL